MSINIDSTEQIAEKLYKAHQENDKLKKELDELLFKYLNKISDCLTRLQKP